MVIISIIILLLIGGILVNKKRYSLDRELKKCESPIETKLMKTLAKHGFRPYGQIPCGKFRIDIAIFYKGKKIAIECDGEQFHSSPQQKEHDARKDDFLQRNRWKVFRFTGKEIYHDAEWCVQMIKKRS
jgi:very-short-patch-repair endonuclease